MVKDKTVTQLFFNPQPSTIMHLDLNSCFASIEQQANPCLRGKPVAVAAYTTFNGCIIAPSIEAKVLGIKVGMRVRDAKAICPSLIVLSPDPWKYRNVHLALRKIIANFTPVFSPKSIDEFVLDFKDYLSLAARDSSCKTFAQSGQDCFLSPFHKVALKIKERIKKEIGEWLRVSIGLAPNRYLAKVAAGLHKPDGLDEINKDNFLDCYRKLRLVDFPYIKERNAFRLNKMGIYSPIDFYRAPLWKLKAAFKSINGYYWYLRLHGYEIDDFESKRRSYGNSYALPKPFSHPRDLAPLLTKLVEKMAFRLRQAGYKAKGIHLSIVYRDWCLWHKGVSFSKNLFASRDIYQKAYQIMLLSPRKPVRELAVSCFNLTKRDSAQLELFDDVVKKERLVNSIDKINQRWGDFVIAPARMLKAKDAVPDRIAFGGVKELEEMIINN